MASNVLDEDTPAGLTPLQRLENLADELGGLDPLTTLRDDSHITGPGRAVAVLLGLLTDLLDADELRQRRVLRLDPDFEGAVQHAVTIGDFRTVVVRLAKLTEAVQGDAPDAGEQLQLLQYAGESTDTEDDADVQELFGSLRARGESPDGEQPAPPVVDA